MSKKKKAKGLAPHRVLPRNFHRKHSHRMSRSMRTAVQAGTFIGIAVIVLGVIYFLNHGEGLSTNMGQSGAYPFAVGNPGPGTQAPLIRLQATDGSTFDLASMRGKTVLLFFQEGLSCQPCWDQIKDMEAKSSAFHDLGINKVVSITTDPLDALKQKVADGGISTPILSDPNFAVSQAYDANQYGMMGNSRDGHSFIVVGTNGRIRWRADYGGSPNYTMYVPIPTLITDIKAGLNGKT